MSTGASTWFMLALGIALTAVIVSVFAKNGVVSVARPVIAERRATRASSHPADYEEDSPRRDPPQMCADDPELDDLVPGQPHAVGGDGPAALRAGNGPLVGGDLHNDRPVSPYVHGTEPADGLGDEVAPFSGDEYNAW